MRRYGPETKRNETVGIRARHETERNGIPGTVEEWIRNETEFADTGRNGNGTKRNSWDTIGDGHGTTRIFQTRILLDTSRNDTKRNSSAIYPPPRFSAAGVTSCSFWLLGASSLQASSLQLLVVLRAAPPPRTGIVA